MFQTGRRPRVGHSQAHPSLRAFTLAHKNSSKGLGAALAAAGSGQLLITAVLLQGHMVSGVGLLISLGSSRVCSKISIPMLQAGLWEEHRGPQLLQDGQRRSHWVAVSDYFLSSALSPLS